MRQTSFASPAVPTGRVLASLQPISTAARCSARPTASCARADTRAGAVASPRRRQFFGESVALSPFAQAFPRAAAFRVFAVEKQSEQQAPEQPAEQAGQQELDPPKPLRKLYPPAEDNLMNKVFWVQAIITAALGFVLAAELVPQFKGDPFWGIMGGWSMWMFVIPSVQARRPTHQARWAINWSFALIPLINVVVPFVYKSFLAVYLTDVIFFLAMYWYGHNGKQFPEDQYVPSDEYLLWLEQTEQFDKLEKYCSDA